MTDRAPASMRADRRARRLTAELVSGSRREFLRGLLRGVRHDRPVFVVGVPRSGTTSLVVLLRASAQLDSSLGESHAIWLLFHHPRLHGWRGGQVEAGEVRPLERRVVNAYFASQSRAPRLLDKTPANSLRIPHLLELFPDACVVVMRRSPLDTISSLMKGWRHPAAQYGTFVTPRDLEIAGYPWRRLWCFALPAAWDDLRGQPLAEVCFGQWDRISAAIEQARVGAPRTSTWTDVYLEELIETPSAALERLCAAIGIPTDGDLLDALEGLHKKPVNALTEGGPGKWRDEHPAEIEPLLPRIAAAARGRGYDVDPATGACVVAR